MAINESRTLKINRRCKGPFFLSMEDVQVKKTELQPDGKENSMQKYFELGKERLQNVCWRWQPVFVHKNKQSCGIDLFILLSKEVQCIEFPQD